MQVSERGNLGAQAALRGSQFSRHSSTRQAAARHTVTFTAGTHLAFYLVQKGTRAMVLARNPDNRLGRRPLAFFPLTAAGTSCSRLMDTERRVAGGTGRASFCSTV